MCVCTTAYIIGHRFQMLEILFSLISFVKVHCTDETQVGRNSEYACLTFTYVYYVCMAYLLYIHTYICTCQACLSTVCSFQICRVLYDLRNSFNFRVNSCIVFVCLCVVAYICVCECKWVGVYHNLTSSEILI